MLEIKRIGSCDHKLIKSLRNNLKEMAKETSNFPVDWKTEEIEINEKFNFIDIKVQHTNKEDSFVYNKII